MAVFELLLEAERGPGRCFEVPEAGAVIGRGREADVTLDDPLVSRRHARVWVEHGDLWVKDLGSRNGLQINGGEIKRGKLRPGDKLAIGGARFQVLKKSESTLGQTVIKPEEAEALVENILGDSRGARAHVLYRAAQLLGTVFDIEALLDQTLDLLRGSVNAQRGFVITIAPNSEDYVVQATLSDTGAEGVPLSHTLIKHVLDSRESMLTRDAQMDSRFDQAASIVRHDIRSAMCAPLLGRNAVVGALYVDNGATSSEPFKSVDLELLTAIARVAGVAVENAQLYKENVRREQLAAIGEATAGLGHCIKNILTGIRGGADFVTMALDKRELRYLETGWPILHRAIERMDTLVLNLLSFSGNQTPNRSPTDLNSLIEEVAAVLKSRADKAEVTLEYAAGQACRASVDPTGIYRIVLNLALNAIEACESKGGKVTMLARRVPDGSEIVVRDTGPGIPEEMMPRLSEAFVTSKGSSGTGLGLACAYKIARGHDGRITADNVAGGGAAFTVFLPDPATEGVPTRRVVMPEG